MNLVNEWVMNEVLKKICICLAIGWGGHHPAPQFDRAQTEGTSDGIGSGTKSKVKMIMGLVFGPLAVDSPWGRGRWCRTARCCWGAASCAGAGGWRPAWRPHCSWRSCHCWAPTPRWGSPRRTCGRKRVWEKAKTETLSCSSILHQSNVLDAVRFLWKIKRTHWQRELFIKNAVNNSAASMTGYRAAFTVNLSRQSLDTS